MYPDTSFEKGKFKPTVHTSTSFSCTKSAGFLERSQSKDFWKHLLLVYVWTDEKGGFGYDDVIHHLLLVLRILCGGCYLISIVLALSCGRAIRVHAYFFFLFFFFLETEKTIIKNTYPDTCGRGLNSFCVFFFFDQERHYCSWIQSDIQNESNCQRSHGPTKARNSRWKTRELRSGL